MEREGPVDFDYGWMDGLWMDGASSCWFVSCYAFQLGEFVVVDRSVCPDHHDMTTWGGAQILMSPLCVT